MSEQPSNLPTDVVSNEPAPRAPTFTIPNPSHNHEAHTKQIYCIRISSKTIVTASADKSVRIWSKESRSLACDPLLGHESSVVSLEVCEELGVIFSGDTKGNIFTWNLENGALIGSFQAHDDSVLGLVLDGRSLASSSRDRTAKTWAVKEDGTLELQHTLRGHTAAICGIQIHGDRVVTAAGNKSVRIWSRDSGECLKVIESGGSLCRLQIMENEGKTQIVGACSDSTVRIYDVESGAELSCLTGHTEVARAVKVVGDEHVGGKKRIISGAYDGTVRIWEEAEQGAGTWACKDVLSFHKALITSFAAAEIEVEDQDEGFVKVDRRASRVMDLQVDGNLLYCSGEGADVVCWELGIS